MNELHKSRHCLESLLQGCDETMDELDFAYAHGLLTASVISPQCPEMDVIISHLLEEKPVVDSAMKTELIHAITTEIKALDRLFNEEESEKKLLPQDPDILAIWCSGFLDIHFEQHQYWLKDRDQEISELILPFIVLSGLFEEEAEFREMMNDERLIEDMQAQLPEVLTELYLIFRS